jgi:hypothetical protein
MVATLAYYASKKVENANDITNRHAELVASCSHFSTGRHRDPSISTVSLSKDSDIRLFDAMTTVYAAQMVKGFLADGCTAVIR